MTKTNVMRLLDAAGIDYEAGEYEVDEDDLSGSHAADMKSIHSPRPHRRDVVSAPSEAMAQFNPGLFFCDGRNV